MYGLLDLGALDNIRFRIKLLLKNLIWPVRVLVDQLWEDATRLALKRFMVLEYSITSLFLFFLLAFAHAMGFRKVL